MIKLKANAYHGGKVRQSDQLKDRWYRTASSIY